jgi:hypothetical protein
VSWCKLDIDLSFTTDDEARTSVGDGLNVRVLPDEDLHSDRYPAYCRSSPPLVVMSLSLKTVMNFKQHVNEIVIASALVYNQGKAV